MHFQEIRKKFIDYFKSRGHEIVPSSSLIPRDDPTLLFTNAGMVQFKGLFLGQEKRDYTRAVSSQKCVRAGGKHNDLDNVGYTARHHTFFEMLGNFSFGDYFKQEAMAWAWELLLDGYHLSQDRLYVSVFRDDDEAYRIWEREMGVSPDRIVRLGEKDNFWAMGDTGPCGPCSEILIDQGEAMSCGRPDCAPGCDCDRYLEIWNLVFTQFDRDSSGNLNPLPKPNIDTGMGLERLAAVVQGVTSNYETDLFRNIIARVEDSSHRRYGEDSRQDTSFRVIADHARAAAFLIGDGVMPSNEGRGYVLRRIIRRAIRFGQSLGINGLFLHHTTGRVIDLMGQDYRELTASRSLIEGVIINEEKRFADTLQHGLKVLTEELETLKMKESDIIPGDLAFKLYDTYGLSFDIVEDVAREEDFHLDRDGYQKAMSGQRAKSQEAWKGSGDEEIPEIYRRLAVRGLATRFVGYDDLCSTSRIIGIISQGQEVPSATEGDEVELILDQSPFYGEAGGQVGDTGWITAPGKSVRVDRTRKFDRHLIVHQGKVEEGRIAVNDVVEAGVDQARRKAAERNHSATHLLHAALREVLGDHVKQAGSLVSPDRLRFDFSHFTQVERERLTEIEDMVNAHIRANLPLSTEEMSRDEALKTGALAIFEERYGDQVRLVQVGQGVSLELCGGTHIGRTGDIGLFKIVSESAVGANLRRIEALTGKAALEYTQKKEDELRAISSLLKISPDQIKERIDRLLKEQREKEREIESLKARLLSNKSGDILDQVQESNGLKFLARQVEAASPKDLREYADQIKDKLKSGIIVLGAKNADKVMLICAVTDDLTGKYRAGDIIRSLSTMVGGKGGGRPDMAQGGGNQPEALEEALMAVVGILEGMNKDGGRENIES